MEHTGPVYVLEVFITPWNSRTWLFSTKERAETVRAYLLEREEYKLIREVREERLEDFLCDRGELTEFLSA